LTLAGEIDFEASASHHAGYAISIWGYFGAPVETFLDKLPLVSACFEKVQATNPSFSIISRYRAIV
jgi:hypothetical protein